MSETNNRSLVVVYSSSTVTQAQLVRSMLAAEGIHATATEVNEPFPGLPVATSEVLVWQEDESHARALIQEAELQHQRGELEDADGDADPEVT